MNTVYLIAGHSKKDPGATHNGLIEASLTLSLRMMISNFLLLKDIKHKVDNDEHSLSQVIAAIKSDMDDIILDIHFNAAAPSATGVEVFVPERATGKEKIVAGQLAELASRVLGIRNRGVKTPAQSARGSLAIMQPAGTNVLLEVAFISNTEDMKRYQQSAVALAEGIAAILAQHAA